MKNKDRKSSLKNSMRKTKSKTSLKSGGKEPTGIEYTAATPKPKFYTQCWFWCVFPLTTIIFLWVAAVTNNEGCPEYTIIEEL